MPIFQDPDRILSSYKSRSTSIYEKNDNKDYQHPLSGNWKKDETVDVEMAGTSPECCKSSPYTPSPLQTSDRGKLIQCIKRGETPTWVFNRSSGNYVTNHDCPSQSRAQDLQKPENSPPRSHNEGGLNSADKEILASPADIERPRSALHSGDFREGSSHSRNQDAPHRIFESRHGPPSFRRFGSSPTTPWYNHSLVSPLEIRSSEANPHSGPAVMSETRSRAPSLGSFSSSYVLKAPTSPLVHQANNTDLDFAPEVARMGFSTSPERGSRCRTLPQEIFQQLQSSSPVQPRDINLTRPYAATHTEDTFPYQAHQPRRSLTSAYSLQLASSPQTPFRGRRPSLASDFYPIIHAPMVGSYEESILRGRMSTTPSKPLDFTAQIGVLGKGKCKSNLRCPPHVTVPFPAVFYSYPTSGNGRSISDDSPSPYVGMIDLENSLPPEIPSDNRRRRRRISPQGYHLESNAGNVPYILGNHTETYDNRKREKKSSRSDLSKVPLGGCYRIPQRGQLQIVIKNPNKTAVKLFLVPYDLDDMQPGTKTFIRQRSYSAGPIIDMPLTSRSNFGTDRPEASLNPTEDPKDKPRLRYLIHLNICCPAKGRFYLHSTIRVVFANRVPDGKEQLRNEVQYPEPRYSPYKPSREILSSTAGARSAAERAYRRRSAGVGFPGGHLLNENMAYVPSPYPLRLPSGSSASKIEAVPFPLSTTFKEPAVHGLGDHGSLETSGPWLHTTPDRLSPSKGNIPHHLSSSSQSPNTPQSERNGVLYSKLSKGEAGYGGGYPSGSISSGNTDVGESLLAQKLKDWSCKGDDLSSRTDHHLR